jgi:hypothetical protein
MDRAWVTSRAAGALARFLSYACVLGLDIENAAGSNSLLKCSISVPQYTIPTVLKCAAPALHCK